MTAAKPQVSFGQFLDVDIRVGTIITVEDLYDADSLRGRQVLAVVNFPPRQIGPFISEVLTLGLSDADGDIVLLTPERPVPDGALMH